MAKVKITGHASGSGVITVTAPNTSTDRTVTLPDSTGTLLDSTSTLDATKVSGTHTSFASTGIDDNANATAITIDSNKGVGIKNTNSDSFVYKGLVVGDGGSSDQGVNIYSSAWGALTFADATSGVGRYEGSIAYNHATNQMVIATNHVTAMTIDSTGAVTMPLQPAFLVNAAAQNNIAVNADVGITFSTERFDQNSDFNPSNYTFTAPVTGKYLLTVQILLAPFPINGNYIDIVLRTSNRNTEFLIDPRSYDQSPAYHTLGGSFLVDMDAGDTSYVQFHQSAGDATTDISNVSYFSGYLAC